MPFGFQKYLVDKGFKRTYTNLKGEVVEDYSAAFLSTYNPLQYELRKDDLYCYWGLCEVGKSAVLFLGNDKMNIIQNSANYRTKEDGYRILFQKWDESKYDTIYNLFQSKNLSFLIDCSNEQNIKIKIINKDLKNEI